MTESKTWFNIRVAGRLKTMVENPTMWAVLTTTSFTPLLEMDIMGSDAHELMGYNEERFQQMAGCETLVLYLHGNMQNPVECLCFLSEVPSLSALPVAQGLAPSLNLPFGQYLSILACWLCWLGYSSEYGTAFPGDQSCPIYTRTTIKPLTDHNEEA